MSNAQLKLEQRKLPCAFRTAVTDWGHGTQLRCSERSKWMVNSEGNRVLVKTQRRVKPWFFEQDGGWYVQCRYGARVISVDGKNNAVFAKSLKEVGPVIDVFIAATKAGELDQVIAAATDRKSTNMLKGAVRG